MKSLSLSVHSQSRFSRWITVDVVCDFIQSWFIDRSSSFYGDVFQKNSDFYYFLVPRPRHSKHGTDSSSAPAEYHFSLRIHSYFSWCCFATTMCRLLCLTLLFRTCVALVLFSTFLSLSFCFSQPRGDCSFQCCIEDEKKTTVACSWDTCHIWHSQRAAVLSLHVSLTQIHWFSGKKWRFHSVTQTAAFVKLLQLMQELLNLWPLIQKQLKLYRIRKYSIVDM